MTHKVLLSMVLLLFTASAVSAQYVSEKNLKKHVVFLSSDKMKGRRTGSAEELQAAKYITKYFKKYKLAAKGNKGYLHTFTFSQSMDPHGMGGDSGEKTTAQNVAAYLDNGAEYTIVIGAHYDHLGMGHDHNSLEANPEGKIHNGADDNASGTAGVMELARYLSQNNIKENHNFLFLCFSGEELGLIGSKKYTEDPTIDLSKVSFMLNMDMIGRLNEGKRIMVGGVGTAPDFVPLLEKTPTELTIKKDSAGIGPSDHTSFYLKDIPVLFFFTGQHSDYHKPSDDADKVNYSGQKLLLDYVITILMELDKTPKLTFQKTKSKKEDTPSFKVTLGIMPDYTWESEGVHVDGVTDGRPADKAGMVRGDVILQMGDMEIKTMMDYMKALSKHSKGETTTVKVKRKEEVLDLQVTF
ncbi:MAG: M20/M25/M40 family metallo-hydrolase [Saprospiraceae bacterium]